jgi:hypothetical protein
MRKVLTTGASGSLTVYVIEAIRDLADIHHRKLADVIENPGSEYTILRPDWFTGSNETD